MKDATLFILAIMAVSIAITLKEIRDELRTANHVCASVEVVE